MKSKIEKEKCKTELLKKKKFDLFYTKISILVSTLSYCKRKKVGCVIVKNNNIVSFGYNGTPTGENNKCECNKNITKKNVIHAELNAIIKASKNNVNINKSTMYITLSPCIYCAKLILQSGVKKVFYVEKYHLKDGIKLLKKHIKIKQIDPNQTIRSNLHCG